jgi:pimeloyl-ACP methyl ester carboxylesterase
VERLVLVHGSVRNGDAAWSAQRSLRDRFELIVLNRPGYPPNPPVERIDFEEHAWWLAERLRPGDHLCGHSYGGIVSLYAAAAIEGLATLTVIEPPAFGLAADDPRVEPLLRELLRLWERGPREPRNFLGVFYRHVAGREIALPTPLPPDLEQGARALQVERGPWEAVPPLDTLAAARFPKLVVSGGWSPAFEAVCDVLEERLAARREVCPGAGHNVQNAPGFNEALVAHLVGPEGR